jgi:hypothetical protein
MRAEIAGRDQQTASPPRAVVLHSAPSHPAAARGRPNAAQLRFTPVRRILVAALRSTHRPPSRVELTLVAVTRRLQIAPADTSLVAATAAPRQRREFGALTPDARCSRRECSRIRSLLNGRSVILLKGDRCG